MEKDLVTIFKRLKSILKKYESPPVTAKWDLDSKYDLWSVKDVVIGGKNRKEVSFAALIIQSNYVGFYFMPVYGDPSLSDVFGQDLMKLLKGKSCFHIKYLDRNLEEQIESALRKGYDMYEERGWV